MQAIYKVEILLKILTWFRALMLLDCSKCTWTVENKCDGVVRGQIINEKSSRPAVKINSVVHYLKYPEPCFKLYSELAQWLTAYALCLHSHIICRCFVHVPASFEGVTSRFECWAEEQYSYRYRHYGSASHFMQRLEDKSQWPSPRNVQHSENQEHLVQVLGQTIVTENYYALQEETLPPLNLHRSILYF